MEKKKYLFKELVVDSRTGLNPRKNFKLGHGNNYYITIKDIHDGEVVITDKTEHIDDDAMKIINKRSRLKIGDVLFSSIGRIGETAIIKEEPKNWNINESVFAFTVNKDLITPEFFRWMFKAPKYKNEIQRESTGSTFVSIKMNKLNDMEFEIPLVDVQKNITSELEDIQSSIINCSKRIDLLNELAKAKYHELFSDCFEESVWEKEVTIKNGRDYKLIPNEKGTFPIYGSGGYMGIRCDQFITNEFSVIIGRKGNVTSPLFVKEKYWNVDTAFGIEPGERLDPYYFYYSTLLVDFESMVTGTTIPSLTKTQLLDLKISIPPMPLQKQFSDYVRSIESLIVVVKKQQNSLMEILNSKIDNYFGI